MTEDNARRALDAWKRHGIQKPADSVIHKPLSGLVRGFNSVTNKTLGALGRAAWNHKKIAAGVFAAGAIVASGALYLSYDYVTKKLSYPVSNVLYTATEDVRFDGEDKNTVALIYEGGASEHARTAAVLGKLETTRTDIRDVYQLKDRNDDRIASATTSRDVLQTGISINRAIEFSHTSATLHSDPERTFVTYGIRPEWGAEDMLLNVILEAGDVDFVNERVTKRNSIGIFSGDYFRSGTELHAFADTPDNMQMLEGLEARIVAYQDQFSNAGRGETTIKKRTELVSAIREATDKLQKVPIYMTSEDGFFKILPQESTMFLFGTPSVEDKLEGVVNDPMSWYYSFVGSSMTPSSASDQTAVDGLGEMYPLKLEAGKKPLRLRVQHHWDFFPGNYWGLNKVTIGKGNNEWRPFSKYNSGGYSVHDERGTIAEVVFQDFFMHHGQDVVYWYYLDKDGNGSIDKNTELIGSVHYRVSQDRDQEVVGDDRRKYNYTFMGGNERSDEGTFRDFYLCHAFETLIVDQLMRGFDDQSFLGWINDIRSNIMLLERPNTPNLGRALTPDSGVVAVYDIIELLRAAQRHEVNQYIIGN